MTVDLPPSLACGWILQNMSNGIPPLYLAQAITYSVLLPVNSVGVVLNIVLICQKKTTFLVRVFTYFSFAVTLFLGILWLNSIAAFKPGQSMIGYCRAMEWPYSKGGLSIVFLYDSFS